MVRIGDLLSKSLIIVESDTQLIENVLGQFLLFLENHRTRLFTSKNYFEAADD
jgi:hypothetical protein